MDTLEIETSDDEELLCCRACLLTDCKLFNIHDYDLADVFKRITGISVKDRRFPSYLCTYCHALLLKCVLFRETCRRSQEGLKIKLAYEELNIEEIRKIDRTSMKLANFELTPMETIDIEGQPNDIAAKNNAINTKKDKDSYVIDDTSDSDDSDSDSDTNLDDSESETTAKDMAPKKGDLKMELEIVEGELKFKVVPEENTKETLNRKTKSIGQIKSSPCLTYEISHVPIKRQASKEKKAFFNKKQPTQDLDVLEDTHMVEYLISDDEDNVVENEIYDDEYNVIENVISDDDNVIENVIYDDDNNVIENVISDDDNNATHDPIVNSDDNNSNDAAADDWDPSSLSLAPEPSDEVTDLPTPYNSPALKRFLRRKEMEQKMEAKKKLNKEPRKELTPEEFKLNFEVDIVYLSMEEQLEEIAERKRSDKYKEAKWKCEDCGKIFVAAETYNNHRMRHDPRVGPVACSVCAVRFPDKNSLGNHRSSHETKYVCKRCGFVSRVRHAARSHYKEHLGIKYTCEYCGETYMKRSSYLSHVRLMHPSVLVACDQCGETFIGKGLEMHKKKMHPKLLKKHRCSVCSVIFQSADALNRHARTAGKHAGLSPCEMCGQNCSSQEALRTHKETRHETEMYICEECEVSFSNAPAFELHFRRKHLGERANEGKKGFGLRRRKREGPAMCDQCPRIFKRLGTLRYHQLRKHSGPAGLPCAHCPKTFPNISSRKIHMQCHSDLRPFQCPACPLAFKSKFHLDRHHNTIHLGIHDHARCDLCDREYTTNASLRAHIDRVHRGLPAPPRRRKVLVLDNE